MLLTPRMKSTLLNWEYWLPEERLPASAVTMATTHRGGGLLTTVPISGITVVVVWTCEHDNQQGPTKTLQPASETNEVFVSTWTLQFVCRFLDSSGSLVSHQLASSNPPPSFSDPVKVINAENQLPPSTSPSSQSPSILLAPASTDPLPLTFQLIRLRPLEFLHSKRSGDNRN